MKAGTYVLLITSPLNAGLNYLLVYTFQMGLLGAPVATGLSYWLSFLLLLAYARYVRGWKSWGGWSRRCLHHSGTFARLAIMGVIHVGGFILLQQKKALLEQKAISDILTIHSVT